MKNHIDLINAAISGDNDAKNRLFENNLGLVFSVVRKFSNRGVEFEDLYQIGCIGLVKAINKFDVSFNVEFSTYAVPMIMGEIKRFLRDDGMIKVSRSLKELALKAYRIKEILTKEKGEEPTIKEIAEPLNVSPEELSVALEASQRPESIYATVLNEKGESKSLIDKIESPDKFEAKIINKILLESIISNFPEREQKIIKLRYFEEKTQTQVAKILNISQVQVSRLEKKLLLEMKNKINKKDS